MGETYGADLYIDAVPRDWLILEEVESGSGPGGAELQMGGWAEPWAVMEKSDGVFYLESDEGRIGPLSEDAAYAQVEEHNHRPLAEAWRSVVDHGEVTVVVVERDERSVDLVVSDGTASYGIAQWYEQDHRLDELLMTAGLAFHMRDDGKYEIPGEARWWRPGLSAIRAAVNAGEAGIVISRDEVVAIIRAHRDDPATIVELISEWLDLTDEQVAPLRDVTRG